MQCRQFGRLRLGGLSISSTFCRSRCFSSSSATKQTNPERDLRTKFNAPMTTLEALPNVSRLSDHVVRVLGQNPGRFTLQGTNTYLIGSTNPYILIDTAEGRDEYIPVLESALRTAAQPTNPTEPDVSDLIISHWHHDHVGGLPAVLSLLRRLWEERNPSLPFRPPRLHKYPLPDAPGEHASSKWNVLPSLLESLTPDLYAPSPSGSVIHDLHDSQIIHGTSTTLRVLHTPGHTIDSISLYIPQDRALYTADTVLGQGTAVFEDLALYLSSLNRMLHFGDPEHSKDEIDLEYVSLYPSHGPIVANGRETIATYIKHRVDRETQILQIISSTPPGSDTLWTTWTLVKLMYASYPESMWMPAARGIDLHLKKLEGEGRVKRAGGEGHDSQWAVMSRTPTPSL